MTCDNCKQKFNYTYWMQDTFWEKVVGQENYLKNVGILCAHCALERIGGLDWEITWNQKGYERMAKHDLEVNNFIRPHPLSAKRRRNISREITKDFGNVIKKLAEND